MLNHLPHRSNLSDSVTNTYAQIKRPMKIAKRPFDDTLALVLVICSMYNSNNGDVRFVSGDFECILCDKRNR